MKIISRLDQATGNNAQSNPSLNETNTASSATNAVPARNMGRASPAQEMLYAKRRSLPIPHDIDRENASRQLEQRMPSQERRTLTNNLLAHLNVGSTDSLNIMRAVFQHHKYDVALLDGYMRDRSPENLKTLTMQIKNNLFVATN